MKSTDTAAVIGRATENVRKQTSFCPEMGSTCPKDAQIKFVISSYKYAYITVLDPSIELIGRGIEARGTNIKGQRLYFVTEAAFNKIEAKYYVVYESHLD